MGFSLHFMRIKHEKEIGADKEGIQKFLKDRNLTIKPDDTSFYDSNDKELEFDNYFSDIFLDGFDTESISAGIYHATLTTDECEFIYHLCVAGKMMIFNPQGNPTYIFVHDNHNFADLGLSEDDEDLKEDFVTINNGIELQKVLTEGFSEFSQWLEKIKNTL